MAPAVDIEAPRQLLAFRFGSDSQFEGQLLGALQRIESGGALRILAVLFVARDADSGQLVAVSRESQSSAGMIGELISFRLADAMQGQQTQAALEGPDGAVVQEIADALAPGAAVAAVLVEHTWAQVLGEAVARIGGEEVVSERARSTDSGEVWAPLRSALVEAAG
jgi:hypothetical protein